MTALVSPRKIHKQVPKSGKFWKCERTRFANIKKGPRRKLKQMNILKDEKKKTSDLAKLLIEKKASKKKELRLKIEENKIRQEANRNKAEIYQIIKNPSKIRRMKRKQFKTIAKRDILNGK